MVDDGPEITAIERVTTSTAVGICISATVLVVVLAAATCYCVRRRRAASHLAAKLGPSKRHSTGGVQPLAFQTHRRPTAVKSPAGAQPGAGPHYLKKSPSPTGSGKSPPGVSPDSHAPVATPDRGVSPTVYSQENEVQTPGQQSPSKEEVETNEKNCQQPGYLGQIVFKLRYKQDKNALVVSVVKCKDLPAKDPKLGSSDPYVKLQLLPDKQDKVKTRVLRKTRNPVYDEDFTFYGIAFNQLQNITLHFVVLSFDSYSRDDIIGEVFCALGGVDLSQAENQQIALSRDIQPRSLKIRSQGRGELLVSLCWQPAANRLTVVVLKARNLPKMDVTGLADPYVKMYLLYNGQRVAKKKTHVKKRTLNPVFNESFVFDVPQAASPATGAQDGLVNVSCCWIGTALLRMSNAVSIQQQELQADVDQSILRVADRARVRFFTCVFFLATRCPLYSSYIFTYGLANVTSILSRLYAFNTTTIRSQGRGELLVSLCWQPAANRLTVVVLKARNLPKMDVTGLADPYVKMYLLYNGQRVAKKKTHVKKRTLNPVFNESFVFDVPQAASPATGAQDGLVNVSLEFLLLDWDRVTKNEIRSQGRGELLVSLCWQPAANRLTVVVLKARNLPKMDVTGLADPYVKMYLLYNGQRVAKKKTHVKKRTLNPVFNESFVFDVPQAASPATGAQDGLVNVSLEFLLLDWDRVTKNKIRSQGRGELLVSLCWQPAANRLTVVVLKARNLPKMDVTGLADPYVKMYLLYNGQRVAKKKTHVKKRTLNPVFNESFVFDVPQAASPATGAQDGLVNVSLEFLLLDWDRVTKNEVIGRLELGGAKSTGSALNHWNEVCNSPRRQIADWHKLRE